MHFVHGDRAGIAVETMMAQKKKKKWKHARNHRAYMFIKYMFCNLPFLYARCLQIIIPRAAAVMVAIDCRLLFAIFHDHIRWPMLKLRGPVVLRFYETSCIKAGRW